MPVFTCNWTNAFFETLDIIFQEKPVTKMICLEIGSFEGMGSLKIIDHICSHSESKLYCVDPWDDVYIKNDERYKQFDFEHVGQYSRFIHNTASTDKIIPVRGYSNDIIPTLDIEFDFAYIDGDHSPEQVYKDAVNVLKKMKKGGVIVFDDFLFELNGLRTKDGIMKFIFENTEALEIIHKSWQIVVRVV